MAPPPGPPSATRKARRVGWLSVSWTNRPQEHPHEAWHRHRHCHPRQNRGVLSRRALARGQPVHARTFQAKSNKAAGRTKEPSLVVWMTISAAGSARQLDSSKAAKPPCRSINRRPSMRLMPHLWSNIFYSPFKMKEHTHHTPPPPTPPPPPPPPTVNSNPLRQIARHLLARAGKRRWRARTPRPVGISVACSAREAS